MSTFMDNVESHFILCIYVAFFISVQPTFARNNGKDNVEAMPGHNSRYANTKTGRVRRQYPPRVPVPVNDRAHPNLVQKLIPTVDAILDSNRQRYLDIKQKSIQPFSDYGLFDQSQKSARINPLKISRKKKDGQSTVALNPSTMSCENIFSKYSNYFQGNLDVEKEKMECGRAKNQAQRFKGVVSKRRRRMLCSEGRKKLHNADIKEYPWAVKLEITTGFHVNIQRGIDRTVFTCKTPFIEINTCTGNIIHRKFILTAAHGLPEAILFGYTKRFADNDTETVKYVHDYFLEHNAIKATDRIRFEDGPIYTKAQFSEYTKIKIFYGSMSNWKVKIPQKLNLVKKINPRNTRTICGSNYFKAVSIHPGYISTEVAEEAFENDIPVDFLTHQNNPQPTKKLIGSDRNDVALLYIEEDLKLAANAHPICLPAYETSDIESYRNCAPNADEQFYVAGYGLVQDYPDPSDATKQVYKYSIGVMAGQFHVDDQYFYRGEYLSSYIIGEATSCQNADDIHNAPDLGLHSLQRPYKDTLSEKQIDQIYGAWHGDSGAAFAFQRTIQVRGESGTLEDLTSPRDTLLGVSDSGTDTTSPHDLGNSNAAETLIDAEWIAREMVQLHVYKKRSVTPSLYLPDILP